MAGNSVYSHVISPCELKEKLPLSDVLLERVASFRESIRSILDRRDDRLLVIVGPCSIHDCQQALEYAKELLAMKKQHDSQLMIVMRVYLEKPRTTIGWKGFVHDPLLDGSDQMTQGMLMARKLLVELNTLGMPCSAEFLDIINCEYYADLISWGCIGARTCESQSHRQMASGLEMPVGFKNGTCGSIKIAVDAILSGRRSHSYLSVDQSGLVCKKSTRGNPYGHIVLRGGWDGPIPKPNYYIEDIQKVSQLLQYAGLPQNIVVDCSHGNSKKKHGNQVVVASYLADKIAKGEENVVGVMIESFILDGNQELMVDAQGLVCPLKYGVSITDACIDLKTTEDVLEELSVAVKSRRHLI